MELSFCTLLEVLLRGGGQKYLHILPILYCAFSDNEL